MKSMKMRMVMEEGQSLNIRFWNLEDVLKSLIKQTILIGQMVGQDLRNQVITIWRRSSVRVLAWHG